MRQTMSLLAISLLFSVVLTACGDQPEQTTSETEIEAPLTETEQINEWFERQYEEELSMRPIELTFQGYKERYDELDDMSESEMAKRLEWKGRSVAEMKDIFDYDKLDDDAKLSYDLWLYQYHEALAQKPFWRHQYIFNQMTGAHTFLPTFMMNFHTVESEQDMRDYNSRLSHLGRAINQLIERAKLGVEEGVRPPRFAYDIVREQSQAIIKGQPFDETDEDASLWANAQENVQGLQETGSIDQTQADDLLNAAKAVLVHEVKPAYENLIAFLNTDIEHADADPQGASALPNGQAYYARQLQALTTTDMSADEIHELGLREVKRLRAEMEALKEKAGFDGTLQAFFVYIRDSKDNLKFYFSNDDAGRQGYIDEASAAIENIKQQLPAYFGILPKADLEVKRVEPFREQDGAPQHYYPGTPDGSRPGIYYAHLSDMGAMPKNELEVIAYHEGLPGHHMQISIAQELTDIPTFRTQTGFTAYTEGWALYSELLAKEMPNTFNDVHSDFGRLGSEMWRAIRLVVDSGMHHKGWTQQQAIDYFAQNSPAPLATIEAEVKRYLVWPAQATAYKVGMIDIQRLRALAEEQLADRFDIRAFHDTLLDGGALPLSMLDRKVKQWIGSQQTQAR